MLDSFNKTNMYRQVEVDKINQLDIYGIDFKDYDFGPTSYSIVRQGELARPDLISFRLYGTSVYWWFIMWFNGFNDPWHDLMPDTVIKYPVTSDVIDKAIKQYTKYA